MGKFADAIKQSRIANRIEAPEPDPTPLVAEKPKPRIITGKSEPVMPADQVDFRLVSYTKPDGYEAESFRLIRTKLFFSGRQEPPRSLMLTSVAPGEGKSFVAANLALTLAHSIDQHVLLIDCDLRNPSVHKQFGLKAGAGLSDHLLRDVPLNQLLIKTGDSKLSILPAGSRVNNPSELLSSNRMNDLLEELKNRYTDRFLIIDAPPPKLVAESYAMASRVDGVLLVINYGKTPKDMVEELLTTMGKEKVLGVIFNYYDFKLFESRKYKQYRKYYQNRP